MLYWIGFTLWVVGLGVILVMIETHWKWLPYALVLIGLTCYSIGSGINKEKEIYGALAKEVSLQQVVVQGQNDFRAQVQITYKDGKLESVKLVPKTTVVSEALKTEGEVVKK